MVHNHDDPMNKIPLKSSSGLDDDEKNGGELMQDTEAAEEARREQMRANMLAWMKKLTIVLICFIGIALISYVIISLCFSDWPKSTPNNKNSTNHNNNNNNSNKTVATAAIAATSNLAAAAAENVANSTPDILATESTATAPEATDSFAATTTTTTTTTTRTTTTTSNTPLTATTPTPPTPPTPTATTTLSTTTDSTFKNSTLTDEQPLETSSATSDSNNNNFQTGDISDAAATTATPPSPLQEALPPSIAASTSPTTPPPALALNPLLGTPDTEDENFNSKLGVFKRAAVCSDKETCSQIGSNILSRNGSAVDAAIATLLCNGLTTIQSMGIGGGMLMNVYVRKTKHAFSIDAREVAPFDAKPEIYDENPEASYVGPLSIGVPGELMGYHRAHDQFGKLPWRELVEPSLEICKTGYYMSRHQAKSVRREWDALKNNTHFKSMFVNPETGEPHNVGTLLKPTAELCNTYKLLAENGPLSFYNGTLADLVVEDLQDLGSIISLYDLQSYFADLVSSITMQLGDDTLYAMPPVSGGSVVAHIFSILEGYNFTKADIIDDEAKARTIHRFVEALKFGFARRGELGDLRFNDVRELVSQLTSVEFGSEQRLKINDSHVLAGPHEYGAQFGADEDYTGTSHLSVLAPNGDAVSVTSSVNKYFGSGMIGPRTGIVFNNVMNDFSVKNNYFNLPMAPSNGVDSRKRPMSSMSPMLLTNSKGDIRLVIGAAGGSLVPAAIVEVAARVLWFGEDLKTAVDAPRFYHQLVPDELEYEKDGFNKHVLELLEKRGHKLKIVQEKNTVVCAISRNETAIYANADFRKRGGVAGF
ncbi:scoloptoxin SSD14 isoform X2 [Scaptodrosophila lebanonensis]|nr:scoloptoxin SSD14 isoform X2 [Scaptodrosophila lebanonensis]